MLRSSPGHPRVRVSCGYPKYACLCAPMHPGCVESTMRDGVVPDELDLALVAALQAAPRADWQRVGHVLGVAGSTAARRWGRLTEHGMAWLACHPMRMPGIVPVVALIEVDCLPAQWHAVAATLAEDPNVLSVTALSSRCDLHLTAAFVS